MSDIKLWRDMTPDEKGALLLAHHEGKVIEWNGTSVKTGEWTGWDNCDDGCLWDGGFTGDGFAYRVKPSKPEPKVETVTLYSGYPKGTWAPDICHDDTHLITFTVTDGKMDVDSIKAEELP